MYDARITVAIVFRSGCAFRQPASPIDPGSTSPFVTFGSPRVSRSAFFRTQPYSTAVGPDPAQRDRYRDRSAGFGRPDEARPEQVEDPVEGGAGRVPGLVDEVLGQDRVGVARDAVGVAGARVDPDADECVAQLVAQAGETLVRAQPV